MLVHHAHKIYVGMMQYLGKLKLYGLASVSIGHKYERRGVTVIVFNLAIRKISSRYINAMGTKEPF